MCPEFITAPVNVAFERCINLAIEVPRYTTCTKRIYSILQIFESHDMSDQRLFNINQ